MVDLRNFVLVRARRLLCRFLGHVLVLMWHGPFVGEIHCDRCKSVLLSAIHVGEDHGKSDESLSMR